MYIFIKILMKYENDICNVKFKTDDEKKNLY